MSRSTHPDIDLVRAMMLTIENMPSEISEILGTSTVSLLSGDRNFRSVIMPRDRYYWAMLTMLNGASERRVDQSDGTSWLEFIKQSKAISDVAPAAEINGGVLRDILFRNGAGWG